MRPGLWSPLIKLSVFGLVTVLATAVSGGIHRQLFRWRTGFKARFSRCHLTQPR